MNILITGAKGFVGQNLCAALKNIRDGKDRTHPTLTIDKIFEYDTFISEYVKKEDINVLGICLGMQIMSLTNYIDNLNIVNNHNKKDKYVHMIKTKESSILREVLGE